jgi:hypothetical protein
MNASHIRNKKFNRLARIHRRAAELRSFRDSKLKTAKEAHFEPDLSEETAQLKRLTVRSNMLMVEVMPQQQQQN